ncbi:hypothetical protein [Altererythrobacter lutimaris]|uniref:Flagellar FliJ protein n=1 Tax=Altererythrobacter lutimaris TaxID=2743979 RepID=A0A850H6W6_9SPHN|nr:hypothetical protein [Altererythrobacter lutimaris]NVE93320.1 hypothetical protein [Altererythrobacter lutimaris]
MNREKKKAAVLARQSRIGAIERKLALRELADAQSERSRMHALAERSEALADNRASRMSVKNASDLSSLIRFSGALHGVSDDARKMSDVAQSEADRSAQTLGRLDNRLKTLNTRRRDAERAVERKQAQRALSQAAPPGQIGTRIASSGAEKKEPQR